jgi:hypothetical protein
MTITAEASAHFRHSFIGFLHNHDSFFRRQQDQPECLLPAILHTASAHAL